MTPAILFWLAWGIGLLAWLPAWRSTQGLTLRGAWWWTGLTWGGLAAAEVVVRWGADGVGEPVWAEPLRFAAAVGVFSPVMSVLGAKRPQHQAWHFIVLSLWAVLVMPAAEVLLLHPGQALEVQDARSWFLAVLVFVATFHLLATRFWKSGLLFGVGQWLLLGPRLPVASSIFASESYASWLYAGGVAAIAVSMVLAWATRRAPSSNRWDQLWRDYRDLYGLLWALRVAQRVNDAAELNEWPVELHGHGFVWKQTGEPMSEPDAEWGQGLENCVRGLLRRFVSNSWIDQRMTRL